MRGGRAYAREAAGLGPPGRGGGEPNEKPSAPLSWRQFLQIVSLCLVVIFLARLQYYSLLTGKALLSAVRV